MKYAKVQITGMAEVMANLKSKIESVKALPSVKVGVSSGIAYDSGITVEEVGFINEFGSPAHNIPERSFVRSTLSDNESKYDKKMKDMISETLLDKVTNVDSLGLLVESDMKQQITNLDNPPNAASTIAQKGSDSPLIDTNKLRSSIVYNIGKGDNE